jgi:N-acetylneuraminic acid mutarotase
MKIITTLPVLASLLLTQPLLAVELPPLPEAVSNQVVLSTTVRNKTYIASFTGIGRDKTSQAIHNKVWQLTVGDSAWQSVAQLPAARSNNGRIGMTGVALEQNFYLFGGYSVATDGKEVTQPDSYRYSPVSGIYSKLPDIPVPVDDSVALTHAGRYIYLISGWHNDGNVNLVQMFDTFSQRWSQATPFAGTPVFGHAAAIHQGVIIVCDGVSTQWSATGERSYKSVAACYRGDIDAKAPEKIRWQAIAHPTGQSRYRQAALAFGQGAHAELVFVGGSKTPYNFNGIGYDGSPAEPSTDIWRYSLAKNQWRKSQSPVGVMDLRNLLLVDHQIYSLGGMQSGQKVSSGLINHPVELLPN